MTALVCSTPPKPSATRVIALAAFVIVMTACGTTKATPAARSVDAPALGAARQRTTAIGTAVDRWAGASTLIEARSAAEEARTSSPGRPR